MKTRVIVAGAVLVGVLGGVGFAAAQDSPTQPYLAVDPPIPAKDATKEELQSIADQAKAKADAYTKETGLIALGYENERGEVTGYVLEEQWNDLSRHRWDVVTINRTKVGEVGDGVTPPTVEAVNAAAAKEAQR